jgi:hypothetical protein
MEVKDDDISEETATDESNQQEMCDKTPNLESTDEESSTDEVDDMEAKLKDFHLDGRQILTSQQKDDALKGIDELDEEIRDTTDNLSTLEKVRSWNNAESVHSRAIDAAGNSDNSGMDFNDSCCSFASFGSFGSGGSSDLSSPVAGGNRSIGSESSDAAALAASRAFKRLTAEPTPRSMLMKQHSMRLQRGMSCRGMSSLQLIEESSSLD